LRGACAWGGGFFGGGGGAFCGARVPPTASIAICSSLKKYSIPLSISEEISITLEVFCYSRCFLLLCTKKFTGQQLKLF
jgi:hypothetical protein